MYDERPGRSCCHSLAFAELMPLKQSAINLSFLEIIIYVHMCVVMVKVLHAVTLTFEDSEIPEAYSIRLLRKDKSCFLKP